MATILTKKKDTSGAPSAGDLTNDTGGAELAVNTADKRLYTKDSGGNVVEVGINPTSITTGTLNTSGAVVFNDAGADVDFRVEGDTDANLLFVDASTDRVGIGTNTPSRLLTLGASIPVLAIVSTSTSEQCSLVFGDLDDDNAGRVQYDHSDNSMRFTTSAAERMRIDSSGNIKITSDLSNKIIGTSTAGGAILFRGSSATTDRYLALGSVDNSFNFAERMRITSGGFLKASPDGVYQNSTGLYHEIRQTQSNELILYTTASSASYSNEGLRVLVGRAASTAYSFFKAYSNSGGDIEFNLRGDGNAYADGSWNGSGADYAEYFESATGEAIPRGTTVVLENNKVRAATADDLASSIIGVVRPKEFGKGSMVVGNLAWNMWTDKYITDDFGVYEMEDHDVVEWEEQVLETEAIEAVVDEEGNEVSPAQEATYKTVSHSYESHAIPEGVTVPANATRKTHDENGKKFQHRKLNPNYDPAAEYTPREERPEWLIIGLLGQVPVLKGQPVGDRWVKMRDISEAVEEWFIR